MTTIIALVTGLAAFFLGRRDAIMQARRLMKQAGGADPVEIKVPTPACPQCMRRDRHRFLVWEAAKPGNMWTCGELSQEVARAQIDQTVMIVDTVRQWVFRPGGWQPLPERQVAERPYASLEEADRALQKYWNKESGGRL